ncbi:hypothetical protein BDZ89DRAFT_502343 [Hymenopellis radicata]|nr:hypothetical protein BDZ89DRAFT_502343 [Hymenopellis radicata]
MAPGNGCSSLSALLSCGLRALKKAKSRDSGWLLSWMRPAQHGGHVPSWRCNPWNAALLKSSCLESDGYSPTRSADSPSPAQHIYGFPLTGRRLLYMMNVCPITRQRCAFAQSSTRCPTQGSAIFRWACNTNRRQSDTKMRRDRLCKLEAYWTTILDISSS